MNKSQAKKKVFDYFKKNAIEYKFVNEELKLIDVDSLDTIYLCASIPELQNHQLIPLEKKYVLQKFFRICSFGAFILKTERRTSINLKKR